MFSVDAVGPVSGLEITSTAEVYPMLLEVCHMVVAVVAGTMVFGPATGSGSFSQSAGSKVFRAVSNGPASEGGTGRAADADVSAEASEASAEKLLTALNGLRRLSGGIFVTCGLCGPEEMEGIAGLCMEVMEQVSREVGWR